MKTVKTFSIAASLSLFIPIVGLFTVFAVITFAEENSPHWSYGGTANPTQWGRLGHDFALCEAGRDQSPINIQNAVDAAPAKLEFQYVPVPLVVVNNGHTIQVNYEAGSKISINGEEFELLQFHFHTPSEHRISGRASAMELHLVHRNQAGELAVVGVMMEKGNANPVIDTIWEHIPEEEGINKVRDLKINVADLLPNGIKYFSYAGSLTTPPCSEGVRWNVLAEPLQVSEEQIQAFEKLYPVNARPIQPTNGRMIQIHKE